MQKCHANLSELTAPKPSWFSTRCKSDSFEIHSDGKKLVENDLKRHALIDIVDYNHNANIIHKYQVFPLVKL